MAGLIERYIAYKFNKVCTEGDDKRDAGLVFPDDVDAIKDISYGDNGKSNLLDLYLPKKREGKLPVLVSAHGGGFVYGDKERYRFYTSQFACKGFAVVNYNYSLAPKKLFPTPIIETNMVYKWIYENADKYNLDKDNIVMIGDSAGAQITSQYATVITNPEYAKIMGVTVPDITLRAVSLGCGLFSFEEALNNSKKDFINVYMGKNPLKTYGKMLNVLDYITSDYPATYIMSSPGDFLLANAEPMYKFLKEKGVDTEMKIYGDENTYHVFFCDMRNETGKTANEDQARFLMEHIVRN